MALLAENQVWFFVIEELLFFQLYVKLKYKNI